MTYDRFEDLPVWNAAVSLAQCLFDLLDDPAFNRLGDLRNQLQRSSLSISNNIAEGFERGTTAELLAFIYIARGSAGETRSGLRFAASRKSLHHLKSQISDLILQAETVSRQLRGWAGSLQNSDIPGQRRMTAVSREEYDQRKRSGEFLQKLNALREKRPDEVE
jgi:four helix bundle protein